MRAIGKEEKNFNRKRFIYIKLRSDPMWSNNSEHEKVAQQFSENILWLVL